MSLPDGIRSRHLDNGNGLSIHFLEAGFDQAARPLLLLLHGFPELAYSWRKIMLPLAAAGFHVVALDQRGYGETRGWDNRYEGDLASFRFLNLVQDTLGLVWALGYQTVSAVVGHDFGSSVAGCCALIRPDIFGSVVMMSGPFTGAPAFVNDEANKDPRLPYTPATKGKDIHAALAELTPPRKHYQWYYSTPDANANMWRSPDGVHAFLRAYYHHKSADWKLNQPFKLNAWRAEDLAQLPRYYIMDLDQGMAETVAPEMPSAGHIASCGWLTEDELSHYSRTYEATGFQGGLQWYRCVTRGDNARDLRVFSGQTINVPSCFISGRQDWGVFQKPGDFEKMQHHTCTDLRGCHLLEEAGHWVQQEQPAAVATHLIEFLNSTA